MVELNIIKWKIGFESDKSRTVILRLMTFKVAKESCHVSKRSKPRFERLLSTCSDIYAIIRWDVRTTWSCMTGKGAHPWRERNMLTNAR